MSNRIGQRTARGALVTLLGGVPMHVLSLILTLVCARLLVPAAFGAYSLALAIYGFSDLLTNPTVQTYLIRNPRCTDRSIDVAFATSAIRGGILFVTLWLLAPALAAVFEGDAVVAQLLRVFSITFLFSGLKNLHVVRLHHELRFGTLVFIESGGSSLGSLLAIALLAWNRDPLSLVIGHVAGEAFNSLATWLLAPRSPKPLLDVTELASMWRFTRFLVANSLVIYALLNLDDVLVAKLAGTAALGIYAMSYRMVNASVLFLIRPLGGVLLPALANLLHEAERFTRATISAVSVFSAVSWCLCGAGWVLATDIFLIIGEGAEWQAGAPIFRALLPFVLVRAINQSMGAMVLAAGRPGVLTIISGSQLLLMIPSSLLGFRLWGLNGLVGAIVALSVGAMLALVLVAPQFIAVSRRQLLGIIVAPAPAALLGACAAHWVTASLAAPAARITLGALAGILTFGLIWELSCRSKLGVLRHAPSSVQLFARLLGRHIRRLPGS